MKTKSTNHPDTVYVVISGSYSDQKICGVFSSEDKALEAKNLFVDGRISEFVLDNTPTHPRGMRLFAVIMQRDGSPHPRFSHCFRTCPNDGAQQLGWSDHIGALYAMVWAQDQDHAIEIANEQRIMWLASERIANGSTA